MTLGAGPGAPGDRREGGAGVSPVGGHRRDAGATPDAPRADLPLLRPDIEFLPGPDEPDGSPTYVLHDPLRGSFERATWVQAEILRRLQAPLTLEQLLRHLQRTTTIRVSADDVARLCRDAVCRGLTMDACVTPQALAAPEPRASAREEAPRDVNVAAHRSVAAPGPRSEWGLSTLFRRLVFLRIPLLRPDAWLGRTVRTVRPLGSRAALALYVALGLAAVLLLSQRLDAYAATFSYFFSLGGVAAFVLTIAAVKTLHELAHAYVAKAMGVHVRTMGVVLIFLFPVAYSDITDSWRLRRRGRRIWIALAGVLAELVLAAVALIVWALAPPGLLKSVCFVVSSVTLLSTLLLNLNPGMRYDGYYVLSDLLGIDNLQSRSFAWTRWALRRHLLGMDIAAPEVGPAARRGPWLVVYAIYAWAYRLFLYTAIALMLYHRLTKAVGAALFVVALYVFLVQPLWTEVTSVWKTRHLLKRRRRALLTAAGVAALGLWAGLPLPRRHAVPATTVARDTQIVYAPAAGELRAERRGRPAREWRPACEWRLAGRLARLEGPALLDVGLGSAVRRGQTLCAVHSDELENLAELARLEVARLRLELDLLAADRKQRALLPQRTEELARAVAKQESVGAAIAGHRCVAAVDGVVAEWDESLRAGTPVGLRQEMGRIIDPRAPKVVCYVGHDRVVDVTVGQQVFFCSDARPGRLVGVVTFVDAVRTTTLEHRGLASIAGGRIPVRADAQGRLEVVDSVYAVEVALEDPPPDLRVGQTGTVWLSTAPRSLAADLLRYGYRALLRESSF